ncbi:MAG: hypothetical protein VX498_10835, partial [Myxococcota bacterium]|nr:hypothetical protein [Myxococcota bacterium]
TRGHGAMEHGVLLGLGLLSIAPIGLITLHQVTPDLVKRAPQVAQTSELDLAVHSEAAPSHASHAHSAHAAKPPAGLDESRETEESSLPRFDCSDVVLPEAPIGSIRVNFREEHWGRSALALLEQRFPDGAWLVQSLEDPDHLERAFSQPPEDWDGLVSGLSTAMHNMVQLVGFQDLGERVYAYPVSETVTLRTDRVQTFPRASILEHIPVVLRDMRITESYLRGQSSSQSFESLLDELNAYTWSLYVEIALKDQHINREVAARDAVLAMLLYTDSYLHQARTKVPEVHARIVENQALLQAVITLWDRAVCVIDLSGSDPRLGIQDLALGPLVFDRETPLEVEELRGQIDPPAEAEAKPPGEPPETSAEEQQAAAPEGAADSQPGEEK